MISPLAGIPFCGLSSGAHYRRLDSPLWEHGGARTNNNPSLPPLARSPAAQPIRTPSRGADAAAQPFRTASRGGDAAAQPFRTASRGADAAAQPFRTASRGADVAAQPIQPLLERSLQLDLIHSESPLGLVWFVFSQSAPPLELPSIGSNHSGSPLEVL